MPAVESRKDNVPGSLSAACTILNIISENKYPARMPFRQTILAILLGLTFTHAASAAETPAPASAKVAPCDKPKWPKYAYESGQHGAVLVGFLISEEGKVIDALIRKSSGYESLDNAAVTALRKCVFRPLTTNGVTIGSWTAVQYVWPQPETQESIRKGNEQAEAYGKAAIAGDVDAIYRLAKLYSGESGMPPDLEYSRKAMRLAAERGHPAAGATIANELYYGIGQQKNQQAALAWYQKAAEHGNANAQQQMGSFYEDGTLVERDAAQAAAWYQKAADQSHTGAQICLANLYRRGKGVTQSDVQAAVLYKQAASSGHAGAQGRLGRLYLEGKGLEQDMGQALIWLQKAAAQREPAAEFALARTYLSGHGVAKDTGEGMKYLRRAALGGDIEAIGLLGVVLSTGEYGKDDVDDGPYWLQKAAALGNAKAQQILRENTEKTTPAPSVNQ